MSPSADQQGSTTREVILHAALHYPTVSTYLKSIVLVPAGATTAPPTAAGVAHRLGSVLPPILSDDEYLRAMEVYFYLLHISFMLSSWSVPPPLAQLFTTAKIQNVPQMSDVAMRCRRGAVQPHTYPAGTPLQR